MDNPSNSYSENVGEDAQPKKMEIDTNASENSDVGSSAKTADENSDINVSKRLKKHSKPVKDYFRKKEDKEETMEGVEDEDKVVPKVPPLKIVISPTEAKVSAEEKVPEVVPVHPRKRKIKSMTPLTPSSAPSGGPPTSTELVLNNVYQASLNIQQQVDDKHMAMFPVEPKPPQGFKDYIMNRRTYTLSSNVKPKMCAEPPEGISKGLQELFVEQEKERCSMRTQHTMEKERLVFCVEQEILRVHGRAARSLANQTVPYGVCSVLKDDDVYNPLPPDQEEKDKNARSRYNGRLFISWLQEVDDKWEKIKEEMLNRQKMEADALHNKHILFWEFMLRDLKLWRLSTSPLIDERSVPMVVVSDDFDLLIV